MITDRQLQADPLGISTACISVVEVEWGKHNRAGAGVLQGVGNVAGVRHMMVAEVEPYHP